MHHNICCCSSFVQCLWAAVQKNNISCCTLKHGVSAQGWCFSPMAALNKRVKRPSRAATGFEEPQKLPCEEGRVFGFRERNVMILGRRGVRLHFVSILLLKMVCAAE